MFFQFVAWSAPLLSLLVSVVCIYVKSWSSPLSPHQWKLCYESTFPLLIFCQKIRKRVKNNRFGTTFQRNRVPNHVFRDNFSDFHSGIIAGRPKMWSAIIVKSVSHFPNHSFGIFPTHRDHAETPTSDLVCQTLSPTSMTWYMYRYKHFSIPLCLY